MIYEIVKSILAYAPAYATPACSFTLEVQLVLITIMGQVHILGPSFKTMNTTMIFVNNQITAAIKLNPDNQMICVFCLNTMILFYMSGKRLFRIWTFQNKLENLLV